MKRCTSCGLELPLESFYVSRGRHISQCSSCKRAYQKNRRIEKGDEVRARKRASHAKHYERVTRPYLLKKKFGLTVEQYEQMLANQGGCCAICGRSPDQVEHLARDGRKAKVLAVDHDHATGTVRGLLCAQCNKGLGNLQDDPDVVLMAFHYLKLGGPPVTYGDVPAALEQLLDSISAPGGRIQ